MNSTNHRVHRILNLAPSEDRIKVLENQLLNICTHFDQETESLKSELSEIKQVVFNRVLSPIEAGKALRIKASSVRKNLELGLLKGYKDGSRWKTTLQDVFEFMQRKPNKYGQKLTLMDVIKFYGS